MFKKEECDAKAKVNEGSFGLLMKSDEVRDWNMIRTTSIRL